MISLRQGDCRTVLPTLPAASVHCVVTSPPYWGLRDYGTATWEGGDPGCDHKQYIGASASSGLNGSLAHKDGRIFTPFRDVCGHCGAIRIDAQLGLEPDFNAYVASMVAVFREVRRVLRDDGTLWLNLGDSYSTSPAGNKQSTFLDGTGRYRTDNYRKDLPKDFGVLKPINHSRPLAAALASSPKTSAASRGASPSRCRPMAGICARTSSGRSPTRCPRASPTAAPRRMSTCSC